MKPSAVLLAAALAASACADHPGPRPFTCDQPTTTTRYRIDVLDMPLTATQAFALGLDLDGDGTVDNQGANVLSALLRIYGEDGANASYLRQLGERLAAGLDWQIERETCPTSGESRTALRDDLVPLGALADLGGGADEGWHPADLTTFRITARDGELVGRIGIGLSPGYHDVVARSFVRFLNDLLDRGQTEFGARIDTNGDGEITEAELQASQLFGALLAPDLDLDGDGVPESLSLGFGFRATEVPPTP